MSSTKIIIVWNLMVIKPLLIHMYIVIVKGETKLYMS